MAIRAVEDDDITVAKLRQDIIVAIYGFLGLNHGVNLPVRLAGKQESIMILLVETCLVFLGQLPGHRGEASEDAPIRSPKDRQCRPLPIAYGVKCL